MWQRRISTRYGLWAALSLALLVAAGWVNWVPEGKSVPYWSQWAIFVSGEYACSDAEFAAILATGRLLFAVPSAILGWLGQAGVGVAVEWLAEADSDPLT